MTALSPWPWRTTVASTLVPSTRGEPILTSAPSPTSRTSANSTVSPGRASSFSTFRTVSLVTRYCLPPVAITAYMLNSCNEVARLPEDPEATRKVAHSTDRGRAGQTLEFSSPHGDLRHDSPTVRQITITISG